MDGIRRLMFAALDDAVRCFLGQGMMVSKGSRDSIASLRSKAEAWIADDSDNTPFGFTFVQTCDELKISASALRRGLLRWRDGHHGGSEETMPRSRRMTGMSRMAMQQNYQPARCHSSVSRCRASEVFLARAK
jgi:hypothetical protein